jgi:23S rRNA pseudouridine2605 synthase
MAKSERPSGKRGETHYNRQEKKAPGTRAAGGRGSGEDRPARKPRTEGDARPFARKGAGGRAAYGKSGDDKPFARRREEGGEDRQGAFSGKRPFRKDGDKPFERKPLADKRPFRKDDERPARKSAGDGPAEGRPERKPYRKDAGNKPSDRGRGERPYGRARDEGGSRPAKRPYENRDDNPEKPKAFARKGSAGAGEKRKSFGDRKEGGDKPFSRRPPADRKPYERRSGAGPAKHPRGFEGDEFAEHSNPAKPGKWDTEAKTGPMTLNKYLAHSGVSSRRDAAVMIKEGKVEVNGSVLTEPGYRVQPGDKVTMEGKVMEPQRHFVYVLLNKPKDFLTTTEDDRGRRTVMELVSGATEDRLYPIGRLDRNTTGVLLLTNDGDLAQKLSHPKYESKKIYQVSLDKDLTKRDFDQIVAGVTLEDGIAKVDRLAYLDKKSEIGLEIHSGRNRIVRRIFESLGYEVVKLDRVMYAGLTKKNVSRGKWRFLTEKEVISLKHFRS